MLRAVQRSEGAAVEIEETALPDAPGPGELLVAMRCAPINPADLLLLAGRYGIAPAYPHVLGAEGTGIVLVAGEGVADLRAGDRVLPLSRGNWAARRLLARGELVRVSRNLPDDAAAMLRINPATAWRLLRQVPLARGDHIIQNGAASSVARWVRRLAADIGCRVINVVRRDRAAADAADVLVDGDDLPERVAAITGGSRIALAIDCVAGTASGRLAATLAPGGTLIVIGHLSGVPCSIDSTLLTARGLNVRGFSLRPAESAESGAALQALYDDLARIAAEPAMAPAVAARFPLTQLGAAVRAAAAAPGGRVMLDLDR